MFYFYYGTDSDKTRARARAVLDAMKKKRPDAEYFRLTSENYSSARFEEFISGQGLFERKFIVFVDGVFERKDVKEFLLERVKDIKESDNAFVFLERNIDASSVKKFGEHAQESKKFDALKKDERSAFNAFALADALGEREKTVLWTLVSEALLRGDNPESLSGMLFWQIKSMLVAQGARSASEAGLKPFVFGKAQRFAKNYSREELITLSRRLISLYHEAHRGRSDLSLSLERFALSL